MAASVNAENKLIHIPVPKAEDSRARVASTMTQLSELLARNWAQTKRDKVHQVGKIWQAFAASLIMVGVFPGIGRADMLDTPNLQAPYSLAGTLFYLACAIWNLYFAVAVICYQVQKPVYLSEREKGLYRAWPYALTRWIAELPIFCAVPALMLLMTYYTVPYRNDIRAFCQFFLILCLEMQGAVSLGECLSSLFNTDSKATHWSNMMHTPMIVLGGFYLNLKGVMDLSPQKYVCWMAWLSPNRWAFQGLLLTQFEPIARGEYAAGNQNANDPQ